jgi:CRISPR-associated endonuclease Cas1
VVFAELGGVIHSEGAELIFRSHQGAGELLRVVAENTREILLFGSISVTPSAFEVCAASGTRLHYFQRDGWYHGMRSGSESDSVAPMMAAEPAKVPGRSSESVARSLMGARLSLQAQVLLMLGMRSGYVTDSLAGQLRTLSTEASSASSAAELHELEERGARTYWTGYRRCLTEHTGWRMRDRHGRPYRDVANRVLGISDGLLARDAVVALRKAGIPMTVGVYHSPDPERPALMMDLMEPFRPIVADVAAFEAIAASTDSEDDWLEVGGATTLTDAHRAHVFDTYERHVSGPNPALGAPTLRDAIEAAAHDLPVLRRSYFRL